MVIDSISPRIWLIGGTQESAALARSLTTEQVPCLVTVTTEAARGLYPDSSYLDIWVGRLQAAALPDFLQAHHIVAILDASHPFAVEISQSAIAIATQLQLPYLRFERPPVVRPAGQAGQETVFSSFQALLATEVLLGQRTLLTVGYRPLQLFQPWQEKATLFARILPSLTALQAAIAAGFTPDRLMALRPPVSALLEQALWHQWQISTVVAKASGQAGGEAVKRQVAAQMGLQFITIARPALTYPQQTDERAIALAFCQQALEWNRPI